jgi:hypothetical protein
MWAQALPDRSEWPGHADYQRRIRDEDIQRFRSPPGLPVYHIFHIGGRHGIQCPVPGLHVDDPDDLRMEELLLGFRPVRSFQAGG